MENLLANRIKNIKPSPSLAMNARANELKEAGKDVINLTVGEPDFDTPQAIKDAAAVAMAKGYTKYTAADGLGLLKEAIIKKLAVENQLDYKPNQVIVSNGAKQVIYNLIQVLVNPEDEVIIPAPYWVSYPDMVKLADGKPVILKTSIDSHFKITPEQLEAAITPRTKLFFINSPSNPTGMVYQPHELEALAEVLRRHPQVIIMSDDIYEHILWEGNTFNNIAMVAPDLYDRTVVVNGVSKSFAMTGWRIGYAACHPILAQAMKKLQSQSTSGPNTIAQHAAAHALNDSDLKTTIRKMRDTYKKRHDFMLSELNKIPGVECIPNDGAFYLFPRVEGLLTHMGLKDDLSLVEYLLNKAYIATVPGVAFGAAGYIRFSCATSMESLQEAVSRLKKLFENVDQDALAQ